MCDAVHFSWNIQSFGGTCCLQLQEDSSVDPETSCDRTRISRVTVQRSWRNYRFVNTSRVRYNDLWLPSLYCQLSFIAVRRYVPRGHADVSEYTHRMGISWEKGKSEVKLSLCLIKGMMKAYGGVEVQSHAFTTSVLDILNGQLHDSGCFLLRQEEYAL